MTRLIATALFVAVELILPASLSNASESFSKDMLAKDTHIEVTTESSAEFESVLNVLNQTIKNTLFPLVRSMDDRIAQDKRAHSQLAELTDDVRALQRALKQASSRQS